MSNDQAGTGGTAAADAATTGDLPANDQTATGRPGDDQAQAERIESWVDAGATSLPALIIALTSALGGTILMVLRRRRKS